MELEYRNKNGEHQFSLHSPLSDAMLKDLISWDGWELVRTNKLQYHKSEMGGVKLYMKDVIIFDCLFRYGDYVNIKK